MNKLMLSAMFAAAMTAANADVYMVKVAPSIDGRLDDAVWAEAKWESGFQRFQGVPKSREVPAQTAFALAADEENLYIGIKAFNNDMADLKKQGDRDIWNADGVEFYFSPTGNTFDFYQFLVSFQQTKYSMFYSESGAIHPDPFKPVWEFRVTDDEKGWYGEAKIPLSAFYMTRGSAWSTTWKMNVGRTYREPGRNCFCCWADAKDYRDFKNWREVKGFPVRRSAEDLFVKAADVQVTGPKDGKLAGSLAFTVNTLEGGDFRLETSFSSPKEFKLAEGDNVLKVDAVFPENGRHQADVKLVRLSDNSVHARQYPVTVDFQPIRLKLTVPQYRGNFYPGQNADKVAGRIDAVTGKVMVTLEGPGFKPIRKELDGRCDFEFDTTGFQYGEAFLTIKAGEDSLVKKIRRLAPLPEGQHMTWIENGRLILDGRPIFRRNMYAEYYRGGEKFKKMYDADDLHQTLVMRQIATIEPERLVKGAERREAVKDVYPSKEVLEAARKRLEKGLKSNGTHYYICDEPECRQISKIYLKHLYEYAADIDPYHVFVCCSRNGENSIEFADVFETHPYLNPHLDENGRRAYSRKMNELGSFVDAFKPLNHPDKCIGGTPTCFSYSGGEYVTFDEYLGNYWAELLRGAKTMYPYAYHDLGDRAALYEGTRYIFSTIEALESFLLEPVKTLVKTKDFEAGLWQRSEGAKLLCVQNFTAEPRKVTVPGLDDRYFEFRGDRKFGNGQLSSAIDFELKPFESLLATTEEDLDKGLMSYADTKAMIEKKDAELAARDNQLFGHLWDVDFRFSTKSVTRRKLIDGNRDVIAWSDGWGKDKFAEIGFTDFHPEFNRFNVYGCNLKGAKLFIDEVEAKDLVRDEDEWSVKFTLPEKVKPSKIRVSFPKNNVEIYELELPNVK